jgi:hypothetical protein
MRTSRFTAAALAVATALATGVVMVSPATAEGPVAACHWIDREYAATYTCEEPADAVEAIEIVECWRYPATPRTYVRQKTDAGWVVNREITVKLTGSKGCSDPYPYRTVVRIPAAFLAEMATTRVRLTMPAHSGTLADGTAYSFGKTVVTYGACLMPEDASDWCAER